MSTQVVRRRRRSVLVVLVLALALALVPHPRDANEPSSHRHFMAVAQEPLGVAEVEDACISLTLLGCVGFVMATFYLVNWPDPDIRRISLEVINATISMFGALLLFHSLEELLEHYLLHHLTAWQQVAVAMLQMLVWFTVLQMILAYYSGAIGEQEEVVKRNTSQTLADRCGSPRSKALLQRSAEEHFRAIKLNTHAWSILLGHATGFAAKNACSMLQQTVPRNFWCCGLVPIISFFGICLIYRATNFFRYIKTMADGEEDEFEMLWGEYTTETEDEVISLAISFLVVQMLRYGISGELSLASGEDAEGQVWHSNWSCALLVLIGLMPGAVDVVRVMCQRIAQKWRRYRRIASGLSAESPTHYEQRSHHWCEGISTMSFAWCLHFAIDWFVASHLHLLDGTVKAVISALAAATLAFLLIFVLDKVADMHLEDVEVDQALRGMITGLGMLVGFSWERCFDASVGGLARYEVLFGMSPPVNRVLLASFLALMVLPAWKWYILPMLHQLDHSNHVTNPIAEPVPALGDETRLFGRVGPSQMMQVGKSESPKWVD